jgi:5-methylcytosine-specific restriction endonuclease McrA
MMIDHIRCVVLNATYEPLSIVSARRGLILVFENKASVVEHHPTYKVKGVNKQFEVPTQIVLNRMIKSRRTFRTPSQLTQRNLFIRDKYMCQYCLRHKSELKHDEFLTRDHVYPISKGGTDEWTNVVTACSTCNNKKADLLLSELEKIGMSMKLHKQPSTPTVFEIWSKTDTKYRKIAKPG